MKHLKVFIAVMIIFLSCDDDIEKSIIPLDNEVYYPLEIGKSWNYSRHQDCPVLIAGISYIIRLPVYPYRIFDR